MSAVDSIPDMLNSINVALSSQRDHPQEKIYLSRKEASLLESIFNNLNSMSVYINASSYKINILNSLRTLVTENPELSSLANADAVLKRLNVFAEAQVVERFGQGTSGVMTIGELGLVTEERAREILHSLDNLEGVSRALSSLPDSEIEETLDSLEKLFEGTYGEIRKKILNHIFSSFESRGLVAQLTNIMKEMGYTIDQLPKIFSDSSMYYLVYVLSKNPHLRFRLGVLLSSISLYSIPEKYADRLNSVLKPFDYEMISNKPSNIEVKPGREGWYLCSKSEGLFKEEFNTQRLILINGVLLYKALGKKCAVCLRTTKTRTGTFVEGNLYSPDDAATILALDQAMAEGRTSLDLNTGSWAIMRSVDSPEFLLRAKEYAESMPEKTGLREAPKSESY